MLRCPAGGAGLGAGARKESDQLTFILWPQPPVSASRSFCSTPFHQSQDRLGLVSLGQTLQASNEWAIARIQVLQVIGAVADVPHVASQSQSVQHVYFLLRRNDELIRSSGRRQLVFLHDLLVRPLHSQVLADRFQQSFLLDGLGNEGACARRKAPRFVFRSGTRGRNENRYLRELGAPANSSGRFQTVHERHRDVHHDEIRPHALRLIDRFLTVRRVDHVKS
jgi:hypothetical protein